MPEKDQSRKYAIIDVETTGGSPKNSRITEIAIFIHNGHEIVDSYSTLINPECHIPHMITRITGINDDMVKDSPKFYEIAGKVNGLTEGCVFVAHNVSFDYSMIRGEFTSLGFEFSRKKLCTVRLARKVFPGFRSYSLGNICQAMNIEINGRHRARGDAEATAILFSKILGKEVGEIEFSLNRKNRESLLPPHVPQKDFSQLPSTSGVYYFYNQDAKVIYIGKAIDIKKRVISHFSGKSEKPGMKNQIHKISFKTTGSEIAALLLESSEIKKYWPFYNRSQKRNNGNFGVFRYKDQNGYARIGYGLKRKINSTLLTFTSQIEARLFIRRMCKEHELCEKLSGIQNGDGGCIETQFGKCRGACRGDEQPRHYNRRVNNAIGELSLKDTFVIITPNINSSESTVVFIDNGNYKGFGYISNDMCIENFDEFENHIDSFPDNPDVQNILKQFLRNNKGHKVIYKQSLKAISQE